MAHTRTHRVIKGNQKAHGSYYVLQGLGFGGTNFGKGAHRHTVSLLGSAKNGWILCPYHNAFLKLLSNYGDAQTKHIKSISPPYGYSDALELRGITNYPPKGPPPRLRTLCGFIKACIILISPWGGTFGGGVLL